MDVSARLPNEILLLSDPAESRSKASSLAGSIAAFLPKYAWLYGSHAYDAVKENFFANNWPKDWTFLTEDAHYSVDDLIGIAKGEVCETWPENLKSFVRMSRELSLPREVLDEEFGEVLSDIQQSYDYMDTTRAGMSRKKLHEVERLSRLVLSIAKSVSASAIVDIGAGQGYLTHRLAEEYPVIALDFNEIQTVGSKNRGEMMKKRSKNGDDASANITYITETLDYNRLVELLQKTPGELLKRGPMEGRGYLLVGLHACGDLSASTMLKTFAELNLVRGLVVVPCCYNLLTEPKSIEDRGENYGFPLSSTVRALCNHHSLIFGHRGRNLACQTFDKFTDPQMRSSVQGHFRRALIDSILTDLGVKPQDLQKDQARRETDTEETERFRIGKLPKEAYGDNVVTYAMHAMAKLGLGDRITREEMEDIISSPRYAKTEKEVTTMIFVRSVLGRVIESFMLLDRYLYLHEVSERMEREGQGEHVRIRMLNLFDFRESPRNAVVIAEKVGKDSI